jgi:hypothetical protein
MRKGSNERMERRQVGGKESGRRGEEERQEGRQEKKVGGEKRRGSKSRIWKTRNVRIREAGRRKEKEG